jgi:hypothetical protein
MPAALLNPGELLNHEGPVSTIRVDQGEILVVGPTAPAFATPSIIKAGETLNAEDEAALHILGALNTGARIFITPTLG